MNSRTNSRKYTHIAVILALMISLLSPVSVLMNPVLDTKSDHSPLEFVSLAAAPRLNLTYHSLSDTTEKLVTSDSFIAGDHVILTATWNEPLLFKSRLEVFAPAIPAILMQELNTDTIEIDTRYLRNNATCTINATAWLTNGTIFFKTFENVYIGNFFVPIITVISPNGNEIWDGINNITWTASDINEADLLRYDVLLSSDNGIFFETLASSITTKWFEWNCSALDKLDTYLIEIRVTDGIYFSSDRSDSTFTAGEIDHTTTTTTTTTTTNGTTTLDTRLTAFIVILLVSCSAMAIVVYYAARKWF
ncbi:MAG: hypothetical protein E4H14_01655 [Candidatus Thorarchaeota archaeon]|nr:MAG: hypothetical protein E4H14_01655 [Candidatus Thorarchaeota archaeon]